MRRGGGRRRAAAGGSRKRRAHAEAAHTIGSCRPRPAWFSPTGNDAKRAALKAEFDKLVAAGDANLHLVLNTKDELFASDPLVNPTVGGTHPSDLGHREIANFYSKFLPPLLRAA